jgi:hypothetical protein
MKTERVEYKDVTDIVESMIGWTSLVIAIALIIIASFAEYGFVLHFLGGFLCGISFMVGIDVIIARARNQRNESRDI